MLVLLLLLKPIVFGLFWTPSSKSIIFSIIATSVARIGLIEISLTARNWPQLFKCSFSKRKKFQMNLLFKIKKLKYRITRLIQINLIYLNTSRNPSNVVTRSLYVSPLMFISYNRTIHKNLIKSYQKTSLMSIQMYLFVEFFNF